MSTVKSVESTYAAIKDMRTTIRNIRGYVNILSSTVKSIVSDVGIKTYTSVNKSNNSSIN